MYRIPRIPLLALAVCTAALAACSDSATGPGQDASDPELVAVNRNLGGAAVVTSVRKTEKVTRGARTPAPSAAMTVPGETMCMADDPYCGDPTFCPSYSDCGEPTYPTDYPSFSVYTGISGSSSYGTAYVTLSATSDFSYASYGEMTASFRNAGGCQNTPVEYTSSHQFSANAPFTLTASRSATYNGTVSAINWEVYATAYAESPGGGWDSRVHVTRRCYPSPPRTGVHRLYRTWRPDHLYSLDPNEGASRGYSLTRMNYFYLASSAESGHRGIYRCHNNAVDDHFLSIDPGCEGRTYIGLIGYASIGQVAGTVPLYRLYLPSYGDHFYTTDPAERDNAVASSGYRYEGITGYVYTQP